MNAQRLFLAVAVLPLLLLGGCDCHDCHAHADADIDVRTDIDDAMLSVLFAHDPFIDPGVQEIYLQVYDTGSGHLMQEHDLHDGYDWTWIHIDAPNEVTLTLYVEGHYYGALDLAHIYMESNYDEVDIRLEWDFDDRVVLRVDGVVADVLYDPCDCLIDG